MLKGILMPYLNVPSLKEKINAKYRVISEATLTLWHGGNLEVDKEGLHKGGKWEHGPGLYLTTHYDTAKKYAKGSRKLYKVVIRKGVNIKDVSLPITDVTDFVATYVTKTKRNDINERIEKWVKDNRVSANIFLNIMINEYAIKNTSTPNLREFLVRNGVDYAVVDNAFGWHETMIVLFNMKNIISKTVVKPKDKIDVFDLPTGFVESDYKGEHEAPKAHADDAPMHDLKKIFPDDIYSADADRLYSSGEPYDRQAISIIQQARGKPQMSVKIYRAVPKLMSSEEKIAELQKHKAYIQKYGKVPKGVDWSDRSKYYEHCCDEIEKLQKNPQSTQKLTINKGDWVAICMQYTVDHGNANLKRNYRILTKTVKAKDLYTDGNSIQEWGYDPT